VTAGTAEVVITTKLFRPSLRQQTVERTRLHDLLRQGRTLPLTLVVAPAGWGKSTLVADWLARDEVTAGWVSLDGGDNDPKRFWRYLLLAADEAGSEAGAAALRRLDAAGSVRMWLDALPTELVATDASLSAARVWVALDTGRLEEVGAALDAAETSVPPDTQLMVLRALLMYKTGDEGGAAARLREISPSADDPFIATVHRLVQWISWMWLGDTSRARELLVEAARRAENDGNRLAYIYAAGYRALLAVNRGDLPLADLLVADAESAVGQTLSDSHFVAMFPALARARLAIKRVDWAGARRAAETAVELGRRQPRPLSILAATPGKCRAAPIRQETPAADRAYCRQRRRPTRRG
jgi:ATP/maltotriose-dependent transcriptional regulator MalT